MIPGSRVKILKVTSASLLIIAVLFLTGCQFRPHLQSAIAYTEGQDVMVQVKLRSSDAKTITRRELYFRLTIINCDGTGDGYPAPPPIEGGRIPGFDPSAQSETAQITSRVPAHIFAEYTEPCVFLQGGGYFTGTIESSLAPIVRVLDAGPNNSFKPNPLRSGNGVAG